MTLTVFLAVLQFLVIGAICVYEFDRKSSVVFLWATLLIMFGVSHLITCISGDADYSSNVLNQASLFVLFFCSLYFITRVATSKYSFPEFRRRNADWSTLLETEHNNTNYRVLLTIMVINFFLKTFFIVSFSGGVFNVSWGRMRAYSAQLSYLNTRQLFNIIYFALSGLLLVYILAGHYLKAALAAALTVISVSLGGNRIEILPLLCSAISLYVIKTKRLRVKNILTIVVIAFVTLFAVYSLRAYRHYGAIGHFIDEYKPFDLTKKVIQHIREGDGELVLKDSFYFFLSKNNNLPNFGKAHTYLRLLFVYIPTRWSFGLKPKDFAITMGSAVGMQPGGSTHPTLFGDCYANLGLSGVFLGVFWAIMATAIDRIIRNRGMRLVSLLMFVLSAVSYVIVGRGSVYNGLFYAAYGFPLLLLYDAHLKKKGRTRHIFGGKIHA